MNGAGSKVRRAPEVWVSQYVIEDWDRVLGDPVMCMQRLRESLSHCGLEPVGTQLDEERQELEDDGGTFAPYVSMRRLLAKTYAAEAVERHVARVRQTFRSLAGPAVVYADVPAYWQMLDDHGIPHSVLSWGLETDWQWDKIIAGGYADSVTIVDNKDKGAYIASLQNDDGTFTVPTYNADGSLQAHYRTPQICLVEDKIKAFASYPQCEHPAGFIVHRVQPPLKSQLGVLPLHLKGVIPTVRGLGSLTVKKHQLVLAT